MAVEHPAELSAYEWAVKLQQYGAQAAIPIRRGTKASAVPWTEYQHRQPDASELYEWFNGATDYGLGIVLGPSLVQVDFDTDDFDGGFQSFCRQYPAFRTLPRVTTGKGRTHVFFRPAKPVSKFVLRTERGAIEFRTGNNIAVVPPSFHPETGAAYEWTIPPTEGFPVLDLERVGIKPPERTLLAVGRAFEEGEPLSEAEVEAIVSTVLPDYEEGKRHFIALALSGWLAGHGVPEDSARSVIDALASRRGGAHDDRHRAIQCVRDTYEDIRSDKPVAGWSALARDNLISVASLHRLDTIMGGPPAHQVEAEITNPDRPAIPYIVTVGEFLAMDLPEPDWLVDSLLVDATVQLVIGPPKTFKTFFATEMHLAMASGTDAFGLYETKQRTTCYVQREVEASGWQRRLRRMILGRGLDIHDVEDRLLLITGHRVRVDDPEDMRRFTDALLTKYPDLGLVTLDTFKKSHGANENDNTEMDAVMDTLLKIRDEFRVAVQLIHHNSKTVDPSSFEMAMRGAVVMWGSSDDGIWLSRIKSEDGDENVKKIKVSFDGRNLAMTEPFGYRLADTEGGGLVCETFPLGDTSASRKTAAEKVLEWVDVTPGWHDVHAIRRAMGWSDSSSQANTVCKRLIEAGSVRQKKGDGKKQYIASMKFPVQDDLDF